jgi:hypothetical protein
MRSWGGHNRIAFPHISFREPFLAAHLNYLIYPSYSRYSHNSVYPQYQHISIFQNWLTDASYLNYNAYNKDNAYNTNNASQAHRVPRNCKSIESIESKAKSEIHPNYLKVPRVPLVPRVPGVPPVPLVPGVPPVHRVQSVHGSSCTMGMVIGVQTSKAASAASMYDASPRQGSASRYFVIPREPEGRRGIPLGLGSGYRLLRLPRRAQALISSPALME